MFSIGRLNSGIRNRYNFVMWAIFLIQKLGTDSVNHADSGDTKILDNKIFVSKINLYARNY